MKKSMIIGLLVLTGVSASLIAADAAALPDNWQSLDIAGLTSLARELFKAGDAGKANRVLVAEHIKTRYLPNATAARTVKPVHWESLAWALSKDLSPEDRSLWITRLREAFAADANAVSALTRRELRNLSGALGSLGDAQWATLTTTWVSGGGDLGSSSAKMLAVMLRTLAKAGDSGKSARAIIAGHIKTKYLSNATVVRTVKPYYWGSMALALRKDLSPEDRSLWITRLREAFTADANAVSALSVHEQDCLSNALQYLGDARWATLQATWVSGGGDLGSSSAEKLAYMLQTLAKAGDSGKSARAIIAGHIKTKYLPNATAVRAVKPANWGLITSILGKELSPDDRSLWIAGLREAFATDANAVSSLTGQELGYLSLALQRLGDAQWATLTATWVSGGGDMGPLSAKMLTSMVRALGGAGDSGKTARALIAGHIKTKYLPNTTAVRAVNTVHWESLAWILGKELSPDDRSLWIAGLREAFATVSALKGPEVVHISGALGSLGDAQWATPTITWVSGGGDLGSVSARTLLEMLRTLAAAGDSGVSARALIAGHTKTKYLASATAARTVTPYYWLSMAMVLCKELSVEDRSLWVVRLREAFAADQESLRSLKPQDAKKLWTAIKTLGDPAQSDQLVTAWFKANDTSLLQTAKGDLAALMLAAAHSKGADAVGLMGDMERSLLAAGDSAELTLWQYGSVVNAWLAVGDKAKAQQWAMRACELVVGTEEARAKATATDLILLCKFLVKAGLTGKGKGYSQVATVVIAMAKSTTRALPVGGAAYYEHLFLARSLGTPQTRQAVQDELLDASGMPRPALAAILAHAYRQEGQLRQWKSFVDSKVAPATGDVKAGWLLARAYAEMLVPVDPREGWWGKQHLDAAMAAATSPSMRLDVVREFVERYRFISRPAAAVRFLDGLKNQFTGGELAALQALEEGLRQEQSALELAHARREAATALSHKQARLTYYRRRLAAYQASNTAAKAAKLQAAIAALEEDLGL